MSFLRRGSSRRRRLVAAAAIAFTATTGAVTAAVGVAGTTKQQRARTAAAEPAAPAQAMETRVGSLTPVRSCESLATVSLTNVTINTSVLDPGDATTPRSCRVNATSTHPPTGDRVTIDIWLPVDNYNGRFQGTGGAASSAAGRALCRLRCATGTRPGPPTPATLASAAASRSTRTAGSPGC